MNTVLLTKTDYAAKHSWQSPERAAAYRQARAPARDRRLDRENDILAGWLEDLPRRARVLDVPCGAGRLLPIFAERDNRYFGADISLSMLRETEKQELPRHCGQFINTDAEQLPYADDSFDCVILWRLFHHLPDVRTREAILREARRVTRQRVILSFFNSLSLTSLRHKLQTPFRGPCRKRHKITHWRLKREAQRCGLEVVDLKSLRKYVSLNWFACLEKIV